MPDTKTSSQGYRSDFQSGGAWSLKSGISSGCCFSVLVKASFSKLTEYKHIENGLFMVPFSATKCDAQKALLVNYRLCFAADCYCCVDFEFCSVISLVNLN